MTWRFLSPAVAEIADAADYYEGTVMHLHIHVIPRYFGDINDPRGGVRWCRFWRWSRREQIAARRLPRAIT